MMGASLRDRVGALRAEPPTAFQAKPLADLRAAPADYADLMDELASCDTIARLKVYRMGSVARRASLPQPWRNAANAALEACEVHVGLRSAA